MLCATIYETDPESYRHEEEFQCGMDVVVIARVNAKTVRISR